MLENEEDYIKTVNIIIWSFIVVAVIMFLAAYYYYEVDKKSKQEFLKENCLLKETIYDISNNLDYYIVGKIYDCNDKTIFKKGE